MATTEQASNRPEENVEEDTIHELPTSKQVAEALHHSPKPNGPHNHSAMDIGFFDPAGVNELKRTITHASQHAKIDGPALSRKRTGISLSDFNLTNLEEGFDFEKVLRAFMKKIDDSENVKSRELGVYFKDLHVVGLGASVSYQPTVGSTLNPMNIAREIRAARHPATRDILKGFEGVVRPGEMLLVLGRPGAGCSSLLKILANQRSEYHSIEGDVHYDSFSPEDIHKHYRGDVQYCPEDDIHFPTLSVEQTLSFAAKTRTPHARINGASREAHVQGMVEILATVFGLKHVKDTLVGDAWIRGISGGQKKRVSITEALATRSLLNSWDNSTRGLDASTALEFVQALRIATDIARMTTIVSIYQAGESLYELFDKVCVIYDGQMVYFGPANKARQYFIDMGYEPANRQTTADFLVAVTDPNGRIVREGFQSRVPHTATEFAEYFRRTESAELNRMDMKSYRDEFVGKVHRQSAYKESAMLERAKHTNPSSAYITSIPMQARALMLRRLQIMKGGMLTQVIQIFSFLIQAVIIGTVFLRLDNTTTTFFSRGGVLFFAILFSALTTMAEIPSLFQQRPIVLRQSKAAMYHPFVESLALTLVDVPITAVTLIVFCITLYFLVGLQETAGQFFIFLLFVFAMTITMKAWFRALAAAFKSSAPAQTVAGLTILILTLYTGYNIPQPSMIGALRWITYINPLKYGFEALMVNEFHAMQAECSTLIPQGPGYDGQITIANQVCTAVGSQPGQYTVSGGRYLELAFEYSFSHLWRNFGIICLFGFAFISAYLIFTEINTASATQSIVTLFKRGSKAVIPDQTATQTSDEEKGSYDRTAAATPEIKEGKMGRSTSAAPAMTDIFSWQHLDYTVSMPDGSKRKLLEDVSGFVAPGKLTALMGESGAGKTTLLNVLAERTTVGVVAGDRFVNGQALPADFQAQTGYCQQMDTHLASSTVREALLFSAKMRQPREVPDSEKEAYVEKCLEMCGLEKYADAIVGSLGVEHRKRTTIAVELAAKPRLLLFLDEPTSGLDSQSAWAIVSFLRDLADKAGQAILCTIHQPSGELFQVFDRLLLLKKGGQTVYFGDIGPQSSTMVKYFERHGARTCKPEENPAEYILQVIGAGATATTETDWYAMWRESQEAKNLQHEIEAIHTEGRSRPPVEAALHTEYSTAWGYQVSQLFWRDFVNHWRDPTFIMAKIALNIVSGLFIGFTFFKSKDTLQGTQNKLFSIFMATIISVPLAQQLQVSFIQMRDLYEARERPSRTYSWTALITSQILAELPWNILGSSLFFVCWYWTVGFPSEATRAGYIYLMLGVAFPLYYTTVGQAIAAMSPNVEIAALLFSFLFSFVLTFNGVLQPYRELGWWRWMYHLSPYTYLIEGLLGTAIGHEDINCSAVEFVPVNPPSGYTCTQYLQPFINVAGGYLANPDASSACEFCAFRTTDQFLLTSFNIEYANRWRDFGIFIAFIAFNIFITYVFTWWFRIRTTSIFGFVKRKLASKSS